MNIYETVNKRISFKRLYELGFRDLTEITQGASVEMKGVFKKKKYQTWYIKIEDANFIYKYYLNSRGQSLKIMDFFENTARNKEDVFRVLEEASFNKNMTRK